MKTKEDVAEEQGAMPLTAFGKVCYDLTHSEQVVDDLTCGRRVGLYELRGEIGSGNFSRVRYGIHALTKGEMILILFPSVDRTHSSYDTDCSSFVQFSRQTDLASDETNIVWH